MAEGKFKYVGTRADGSQLELVQDCDCLTHDGPHDLHMIEIDLVQLHIGQRNVIERAEQRDSSAFALMEGVQKFHKRILQDQISFFTRNNIVKYDRVALDPAAAGQTTSTSNPA